MSETKKKKSGVRAKKPRLLTTHVTHLEMTSRPTKSIPVPTRPMTAVMIAKNIVPDFYQYLYRRVGKPHHWFDRRHMNEDALDEVINSETCEIAILYADGCPAGFYELNLEQKPKQIEIRYFGLLPEYQGIKLGKWFLALSIQAAWAHAPEKVVVDTNTLDHPTALRLYQRLGFSPYAVSEEKIEAWD